MEEDNSRGERLGKGEKSREGVTVEERSSGRE